ncbi:MAG: hypothetical protein IKE08_08965 [Clostridia bacterium]|nr:hypothetical protein [Clostridia bacterium]
MTEHELRTRLNDLTSEIPAETHRAFLSAVFPGKVEVVMKKKISIGLIIAILVSLAAIAFAATELTQKFISVNWQGETATEPGDDMDTLDPVSDPMIKMRKILYTAPDDVAAVVEWNGTPPRVSKGRSRKTASFVEISYNTGIVLPDKITEQDSFEATLTYGCLAEGDYELVSEEKVDEFTLKQYTVNPAYDIVIGYSIGYKDKNESLYKDENKYWRSIRSQLSISLSNQFQFEVMDGEEHSAQSVEIPGMDKAVFINLGMNTRLIAIRTLDKTVVVKTEPSKRALGDKIEYKYELIEMDGFTLEECMGFFQHE